MVQVDTEEQRELLAIATLIRMGFEISRLEFYRWLVEHGRDPEWVDVQKRGLRPGTCVKEPAVWSLVG